MRISKIKLEVDGVGTGKEALLCNGDLLPTPPSKRTWNKVTYSLFWFAEQASVTSWTVASTGIFLGLSWWERWLCVILGRIVITFFMVMSGRPGMVYKIPFPVIVRSSFGVYGGFWPFFNRNAMTIIWCGVQGITTGNCIYVMLYALTPKMAQIHNPFSSDYSITGGRLVGFAIGWVVTLLLAFVPIKKKLQQGGRLEDLADAGVAAHFPHLVSRRGARRGLHHDQEDSPNNSDLTRNAAKRNDALYTQMIAAPMASIIVSLLGILVTSTSEKIFGRIIWDPTKILEAFLTTSYSAKNR
ncbi:hypothetical protein KL933_002574 [Ogataea haglerorum]|uniref:Uncharacterized protein n=1 Tax=Ogataea haglerorum TaxID=1937702 RepID=A0AAN6I1F0_9ASCO|nr:hypothetical protein KL933_002574 [Ogataea haglerorum]KAG7731085.1 hypothetical protein KL948_003365 [Ogataea haglerorum]